MILETADLKHLQRICLEMVEEVDRICRKNGIEYTLDGGTLLGAVREGGFIPWDDDADIVMTREAYEKFALACRRDLNTEKFFLQDHHTDPAYPWGYAKLRRNGSREIQTGQGHLTFHPGIFIDLFIYDPVPDGFLSRRLHAFACFCIRKCQYSAVGKLRAGNAFLRGWYALLDKIPKKTVFAALDRLIERTRGLKTELASHKTYPYFRKSCRRGLPARCLESYTDAVFEGRTFRIMKDYDTYLTAAYGDYMTPPPASDRKHYPIQELEFPD